MKLRNTSIDFSFKYVVEYQTNALIHYYIHLTFHNGYSWSPFTAFLKNLWNSHLQRQLFVFKQICYTLYKMPSEIFLSPFWKYFCLGTARLRNIFFKQIFFNACNIFEMRHQSSVKNLCLTELKNSTRQFFTLQFDYCSATLEWLIPGFIKRIKLFALQDYITITTHRIFISDTSSNTRKPKQTWFNKQKATFDRY